MRRGPFFSYALIWLSILCAALLQVMPLPPYVDLYFRPNWMLLISVYWCLAMPHRFNLTSAWGVGLILDILWGYTLGINALAFGLSSAIVIHHCQKIRSYSLVHQALIVTIVVALSQFITAVITSWIHHVVIDATYFMTSLITLIVWPWIFLTLRKFRRRYFLN